MIPQGRTRSHRTKSRIIFVSGGACGAKGGVGVRTAAGGGMQELGRIAPHPRLK